MSNFRIITISQQEREEAGDDCLLCDFDYMVEHIETGGRWFGSNIYSECEDYIANHT